MRTLVRRSAASPFALDFDRTAHPSIFRTRAGWHAVVRTGTFDLVEAAPDTRRRQVDLFEDLLGAIELPVQLLVASRRADHSRVVDPRVRQYLADQGADQGGFSRTVHLVVTAPPSGAGLPALGRLLARGVGNPQSPDLRPEGRLLHQVEAMVYTLRAMSIGGEVLSGGDLDRFLYRHLPRVVVSPAGGALWREQHSSLEVEGELTRTLFLEGFPGSDLEAGWLGPVIDIRLEYDLAIHATPVPMGAVMRLLNTRIRELTASRMADGISGGVGNPLVDAGLPEAVGLRRAVAANEQRAVAVAVYLTVRGRSAVEVEAAEKRAAEAAARCLGVFLPATLQMARARTATLPVGEESLVRGRIVPSRAAATFFPWLWDDLQQPAGHLVGHDARSGCAVLIDTFDEARFANANIGIFGHSGAGKTHLMKTILHADASAGIGAFVIDPEAEYRATCEAIGGEWVDLALGGANSINVMDAALAQVGDRDALGDQVSDLLDLLHTMCGQLLEDERAELHDVLGALLTAGVATLADVRADLERRGAAPRVSRLLRRWTEGPLGRMFSSPTSVRIDSDCVVFGLRDVKDEFLPVAYFLIAQWIWSRVRATPRRRRILFDEVGLLFEHPPVRRFLVRLARRVRKYQGSLCIVTQNAGDLLGSDQGLVLATNPSTLFLGAQREAEAVRMQRAFGLTDAQARLLGAARRGEFLLLAGQGRHRVRVAAPPWVSVV